MESAEAFSPHVSSSTMTAANVVAKGLNNQQRRINRRTPSSSPLRMASSDAQDEVAMLREMAAKAREDAARLAKELGYEDEDLGTKTEASAASAASTTPQKSPEEILSAIRSINFA